jgi:predicted peptidase
MRYLVGFALSCVVLACTGCASAPARSDAAGKQQSVITKVGVKHQVECRYLLYLPARYDSQARWPLILFLHGMGERGSDLELVKKHGPPKLIAQGRQFPFIIVSPQCPDGQSWSAEVLGAMIDRVESECKVDPDRIYLTGLSMGGFGTWDLACADPDRFAAIAPICGGGDPKLAKRIRNLPTWVFHGDADPVVSIDGSKAMVEALKAAGGNVKFTIYPGVGHDSWTQTYDNPELYAWFLSHRRGESKPSGSR